MLLFCAKIKYIEKINIFSLLRGKIQMLKEFLFNIFIVLTMEKISFKKINKISILINHFINSLSKLRSYL